MSKILEVKNLSVSFDTYGAEVKAVRDVSFQLNERETLAIVGESGSGKSVTAQSVMRLVQTPPGKFVGGEIRFNGEDLLQKSEKQMESIRGKEISMIFQDPMTSLNPTMTIGKQIAEGLMKHQNMSKKEAHLRGIQLLKLVGIPTPEVRIKQYPHQYSGGMRQRAMIAIALSCNPKILIADEPTTALDVTIQAQILELMRQIQEETGTAIILITHDLGVVANTASRVAVMYGGKIVESATVDEIFFEPKHPYTWGLLGSMPKIDREQENLQVIPGSPPDLAEPPKGCPFVTRCPYAMNACSDYMPAFTAVSPTHEAACWLLDERAPKVDIPESAIVGGEDVYV
ncbi:ATP-binding cassette domain-containing protein [Oceanobacillus sp. 143]|uniref:Peptide ABC transporter ATP-binding protein n=1 Tax=Oceanobacillus zhaokaii TaxID=2052660 RepID=A0A345PL31_9BACI|nr:ABC transporter ATP-binding protein [Oceanobacillus zhaokaii]AXI10711.1 peptide ABC transporter ATP-binding protein [Oceanobacillus zhaokaii]QGS69651.1 ATP-binding cassette domain-containing protein [Oceanobacillus sp. 143]